MEEITAAPPPSIIQEVPPVRPAIDPRRYPELGLRIRSIMIDTIVLIALMFAAGYVFASWRSAPESARMWAFLLIWFGYEPITMALGGTVGNLIIGLRVRKASDESKRIKVSGEASVRLARLSHSRK